MPNDYTKTAIKAAFIRLLNERPLNKISVKSIVDICNISRNTFYYHYQDIPSLLEEIIIEAANTLTQQHDTALSMETCIESAYEFAKNNRRAVYHIYTSSHRLELEKHVDRISGEMMHSYVEEQARGLRVSEADKKLVCDLYRFGITDIFYEWLENGMKEDLEAQIRRLSLLFTGNIRASLSRVQIPAEA